MIEKKNTLYQINASLDIAEENISKTGDITIKTIQHVIEKKKTEKKYRGSVVIKLQDNFLQPNVHDIGTSSGKKEERGKKKYWENHGQKNLKFDKNC